MGVRRPFLLRKCEIPTATPGPRRAMDAFLHALETWSVVPLDLWAGRRKVRERREQGGEAFTAVMGSAGLCRQTRAGRKLYIQAILGIIRRLEASLCIRRSAAPDHHQSQRRAPVFYNSRISALPLRRKRCFSYAAS